MVFRLSLASVIAILLAVDTVSAQPSRSRNPIEVKLRAARLDPPQKVDTVKFNQMRNGNVALNNPTPSDREIVIGKAQQLIYPVTHYEFYTTLEAPNAELTPRSEDMTISRLISDLEAQLVIITPGDNTIPAPKVDFAREFGVAAVKAIDDVLAKGPHPLVRMNAVRMLGVVAKSGAPAATERIVKLLGTKDVDLPVESLYYGLKAAEQAIAMYDPGRSAPAQKWVSKDAFYELVSLVNEVVLKVPESVPLNTATQSQSIPGALSTEGGTPNLDPTKYTPEQIETVQMFRLQAVRALAKVRTDVVFNANKEKKILSAYTLAKVAVSDTSLVPSPTPREVIEAVGGLATASPDDIELDAKVLAIAMAYGVSTYITDKVAGGVNEGEPQRLLWRLTGTRMKVLFQEWEKTINKSRLDQNGKAVLRDFAQLALTQVFEPLSRQSDTGVANGLNKEAIENWKNGQLAQIKTLQLFKDTDRSNNSVTSKLTPR